ncbi:RecQ family ATP-dependent DNA helicase [Alkalihalobacillus sp. LMS6]|uniref:RecQ family ATP-dependent DNA helicase n=1 Tax=Alkalihalobacillus sp. LMS6 TaxID=2924034 RepID=UPI0020D02453|nr:RecQ family ATP-dependent DNA helicase [Alkalihalobacillus sp. LMS6]UTR04592.1 RecQ family ATP-dependent DNA helicase [Alkalihalobacillus sp. LMS6]
MLERDLQRLFGFTGFKKGQKEIIESLMAGHDVFAMLPTGRGKSLCYQLPAFLSPGLTIVVSPLLSLMEDQVTQLKKIGRKEAVAMNSFSSREERKAILQSLDSFKLIYLSPEMLQSKEVFAALADQKISYFIIDEAHCVSYWGHDFRADYLRLRDVKASLGNPPTLAITATADENVRRDVIKQLHLRDPIHVLDEVNRSNIALFVEKVESEYEKVIRVKELLARYQLPGLLYTQTRAQAEWYSEQLQHHHSDLKIGFYHGGMDSMDRMLVQEQFINNQLDVICATNAFGMGVNKPDIHFIIHLQQPLDIASYVQEIGRAGRDGSPSFALVFVSPEDRHQATRLIRNQIEEHMSLDMLPQLLAQPFDSDKERKEQLKSSYGEQGQTILFLLEKWGVIIDDKGRSSIGTSIIEKLKVYFEQQERIRQQRLGTMMAYIDNDQFCRRELLLRSFNESVAVQANCCDQCGATLSHYKKREEVLHGKSLHWKQELALLFHQTQNRKEGDISE